MPTAMPGLVDVDYCPEVIDADYQKYDQAWLAFYGADAWTRELCGADADQWRDTDGKLLSGASLADKAFSNFVACNCGEYASFVRIDTNVHSRPHFTLSVFIDGADIPDDAWTVQIGLPQNFDYMQVSLWAHFCQIQDARHADPVSFLLMTVNVTAYAQDQPISFAMALAASDFNRVECLLNADNNTSSGDKPGGDRPGGDTPGDDTPGGNKPGNDTPAGNKPGGDAPGGDTPGGTGPVPPQEEDKYDNPEKKEYISGDAEVTSPAGQDTWFVGSLGGGNGLSEDSVINGGADANNSLVLDIYSDWPGFAGVTQGGVTAPSVTNIGRVLLNNKGAVRPHDNLNFDAKNISSDVEQFDIDNSGNGAVSLSNLPTSARMINIKDINAVGGEAPATSIGFVVPPAYVRLGLEDVCADGGSAPINMHGVRELEIVSRGLANSVNLKETKGVEKLALAEVKAQGSDADAFALTIADSDGSTIRTYDASAMTRNVNIGVSNFQDGAVVKGGSGKGDALTFVDNVQVAQANWSGIEGLIFKNGGDVDLAGASGISAIVQDGNRDLNLSNLDVDRLNVVVTENAEMGLARTCAILRAQGKIGDVSWSTHGAAEFGSELTADFVCDATGDAYITMRGKDRLGVSSVFEFRQMTGTLTIDDPNPTDPNAYLDSSIMGVMLQAEKATGLDITHTGSMKICGALWKVENVAVKMTDYKDAGVNGLFKLPELPSASNVDISADRMDIYLSGLGSQNNAKAMDLAIHNAADVYIDHIKGASAPVKAVIDSYGDVEIGRIESASPLDLTVSGVNITATQNDYNVNDGFIAAGLNIDFGEIYGNVGSGAMFIDLEAINGALNYIGAGGSDNLLVGGLGGGTISSLDAGTGDDEIIIQTLDSIGVGQTATLNVDLGSGYDILRVFSMNQEGNLLVNVAGGDSLVNSVITYDCPYGMAITSVDAANWALNLIDAGFQLDAGAIINDGVFEYGGNAYWLGNRIANGAENVTLVAAEGARADLFVADDLAGG